MYRPDQFRMDDVSEMHEMIRAHPFGVLVSAGASGLLATHLPVVLKVAGGNVGVIECHFARPNTHWRELSEDREALFIFQGPEGYIRPGWYPSKSEHGKVVPTWNYAAIHAYGRPAVMHEDWWLNHHIRELSDQQERLHEQPWSVDDAPEQYVDVMRRGIVGLHFEITRLEGKLKMSQNRNRPDQQGVVEGLIARGRDSDDEMARMVRWITESGA